MVEFVRSNKEVYIIIYCFILLWVNIDYLRDYKKIKKELSHISSDDELEVNPEAISLMFFVLIFNFFRSWLIYLLAVIITENIFVAIISTILFVIGLYNSIFNYSVAKVKKSKIKFYLVVMDTIFMLPR